MSRYLETSDTIKKTAHKLGEACNNREKELSTEQLSVIQLSGIFNILTEIALSLAVIADKEAENE